MDDYIEEALADLHGWTDLLMEEMLDFAATRDLEPAWVVSTFARILSYKAEKYSKSH